MPTYTYRCKACSHQFEEWQKMSDDPLVQCPSCKQNTLVRLIGGAGLIFKGSGFYLTDYKKNNSAAGKEKKMAEAPEKKSETPASEKPTKKEAKSPKTEN